MTAIVVSILILALVIAFTLLGKMLVTSAIKTKVPVNSSDFASMDYSNMNVNRTKSFVWDHSVCNWISNIDKSLIHEIINGDISLFIWILGKHEGLEDESTDEIKIRHQIECYYDCSNNNIVIKGIFRKKESQIITGSELEIVHSIEQNVVERTAGKRFAEIEFDIDN